MRISIAPTVMLKPSFVSMAAMFASLAAWLFPSFGVLRKGFEYPSRITFNSLVVLSCWYLLIFMSFAIGEKAGRLIVHRRSASVENFIDLDANFLYYVFSVLSALGLTVTIVRIVQLLSMQQIIVFIVLGQINSLKDAVYEDYSIGIVSLRYLVLFPASIALYRMIRWRSFSFLNVFNVLMLVAATLFLGSRLMLVATLLTVVFLIGFGKRSMRISFSRWIIVATVIFLILSGLNFSRNADYYESHDLSFGLAGVSEILAYLGAPFQAAIASAPVTDQLVAGGDQTFRDYADVETNLNTDSAFVHVQEQMGYAGWVYISAICLFMGFVFEALASLGKTFFLLPCGAILYGSAELWRLDLFHQGIFIVWFVMGIGLPLFLIGGRRVLSFMGNVPA